MTTVAYKEGILAGDRLITDRGTRVGFTSKVTKEKDGSLIGIAGCLGSAEAFRAWIRQPEEDRIDGVKPDLDGNFEALRITPEGVVEWYGHRLLPSVLEGDCFAIGSGTDFALGAMGMGATAQQAVEVSMRFDTGTGGAIEAVSLKGWKV